MARQINLYDPALRHQRDWLALGNIVVLAAVLAALVGALGVGARSGLDVLAATAAAGESQLKAARDQIVALGQQAANRQPDPRVAQELAAKRMLLTAHGEVLRILRESVTDDDRPDFDDFLRGLARQTLSGLWLTAFSFDARSGGMEIRGRTVDPALLPEYIRRLNRETAFQGRAFASLKIDAGKPDVPAGGAAAAAPAPVAGHHEFVLVPVADEAQPAPGQAIAGAPANAGRPG
jgi:hypothetical protein